MKKKILSLFMVISITMITLTPTMVSAGVTDPRKTVTVYHTKVQGSLNITGTDTYSKNYSSGDEYLDGNYTDTNVANIINEYKSDMSTIANSYNSTVGIVEGLADNYYANIRQEDVEVTAANKDEVCADVVDASGDPAGCDVGDNVRITTIDRFDTYTLTGLATAKNIKNVNVTIKAPVIGDTATATTKPNVILGSNANYEIDHIAYITAYPSAMPIGYDEPFIGTFEANKDYYIEVSLIAKNGYKFKDNDHITLKVNGKDTDFEMSEWNADGSTYYMFYAKIKATDKKDLVGDTTIDKKTNNTSNPKTGDNVMFYISMLGLSIISLVGTGLYIKKRKFN